MPLSRLAVQELYTKGIDRYSSFISAFQSPQGIQALLQRSDLLRAGLRVLDAGCGFGVVTFAFLQALGQKDPVFRRFPWRYIWLNRATFAVEAGAAISGGRFDCGGM